MNARRKPRLFLDHKPPLVAFTVVAVACSLMMVHMARSEAAPGWLRAGLGPIVGQHVVQATLLHPDEVAEPAEAPVTEAAGPLVGTTGGPSQPSSTGAKDRGADPSGPEGGSQIAGALVGVVVQAGDSVGEDSTDDGDDADGSDDASDGPGEGRGNGEGDAPVVTLPDQATGPTPRDHSEWRDEWVGSHGRGHGHQGHAGHGSKAHGPKAHGVKAHGSKAHGVKAHGHGGGSRPEHGHGDHGHGHAHAEHGHAGHGHGHH